jgi:hypothetical protein
VNSGVYEHVRHPGNYYLLIGLARDHHTDEESVVYVPLRVEPEWAGSARMALRRVEDFDANFKWVGYRLPRYLVDERGHPRPPPAREPE